MRPGERAEAGADEPRVGEPGAHVAVDQRALRDDGDQQQHDRDDEHAEQVGVVVVAVATAREEHGNKPRAQQPERGALRAEDEGPGIQRDGDRQRARAAQQEDRDDGDGAVAALDSQPNSPSPATTANCAAVLMFNSDAVRYSHGWPSSAFKARFGAA